MKKSNKNINLCNVNENANDQMNEKDLYRGNSAYFSN